jgi:hypothetical protein
MLRFVLTVLVLIATPLLVLANFGVFRRPAPAPSYYYPAPVFYPAISVQPAVYPIQPEPQAFVPLAPATFPAAPYEVPQAPSFPLSPAAATCPLRPSDGPLMAPAPLPRSPIPLAAPSAAPPSLDPTPIGPGLMPRASRSLSVNEFPSPPAEVSTSFYQTFPSNLPEKRGRDLPPTLTLCNAAGKAVMVRVDGVRYLLVVGQTINLEARSDFAWQVEGREAERGRIPPGERGLTIVIRR